MNLSTVALLLLAWQLLKGQNNGSRQNSPKTSPLDSLSRFLSQDTKDILSCVNKLTDKQCSQEDKTGAIFQMMTNPAVMNIASNLFQGGATNSDTNQAGKAPDVNAEGYKFDTPSQASQEFFRPIDNIADSEVKHKLYWFYDNWYIK